MAKEVNKRVNVFINGKEVENNIKSIRAAMAHLTNQLNKMTIGVFIIKKIIGHKTKWSISMTILHKHYH